jgi:putative tryptophan/tyrosine transport system substrate-binding protein
MRRRDLLVALITAITAQPGRAQDPNRVYRIGYLGINPPTRTVAEVWKAFDEGLREHGLIEGQNVLIERRFSEGREERQPGFVAELLAWKADVIVSGSVTGAKAAREATKTIPIILAGIGDPDRLGLVDSLARPGGNITGLSSQYLSVVSKQYQLLKEIVPSLTRLAVLWNPNSASSAFAWEITERETQGLDLRYISVPIVGPADVSAALEKIEAERAEALDVYNSVMPHRAAIYEFALRKRLPVLVSSRLFLDEGALISYGPSLPYAFRRAAAYIDKVLKGTKPADLPIEQPTKWELSIQMHTARAIGIKIPATVLALADEVIE